MAISPPVRTKSNGWLGTTDVARLLGVNLRRVYQFIDTGQLPAYMLGRVIRIRQRDLDAFIESCRVQPGDLAHLLD